MNEDKITVYCRAIFEDGGQCPHHYECNNIWQVYVKDCYKPFDVDWTTYLVHKSDFKLNLTKKDQERIEIRSLKKEQVKKMDKWDTSVKIFIDDLKEE